jgi:arylsulfatase A-like enzyme
MKHLLALLTLLAPSTADEPRARAGPSPWPRTPAEAPEARWLDGGLARYRARAVAPPQGAPRVLLVLLDDLGFADAARPELMPNLHALGAAGIVYVDAHANATCSPTRHSIHTGRWKTGTPGEVTGPIVPATPPAGSLLLALSFPGPSWLYGKWHLGTNPTGGPWEHTPAVHGFGAWFGTPSNVATDGGSGYRRWIATDGATSWLDLRYEPTVIRDELAAGLGVLPPGPALVVWAPALVHAPFHFPPASELPAGWPTFGFGDRVRYEAMIASVDLQLGQALASIGPEWLVVVVGDNGTPLEVSPRAGRGKTTTWREGTHVPFVVRGPGIPAGVLSSRLVHVADVLPTVLQYAGVAVPSGLDGLSLYPSAVHDWILVGHTASAPGDVAVRSKTRLLREVGGVESFFDTALDPMETVDRIADPAYAADLAAARAYLAAHRPSP